jgi:hypothetical protein
MKSFLTFVFGGALLLGLAGVGFAAWLGGDDQVLRSYLLSGGIGAFFGAKFGLIGWFILAAVRVSAAVVAKANQMVDQNSGGNSK